MIFTDLPAGAAVFLDANTFVDHFSQAQGILSNDAILIAVMQANGLTNLASHDADFDRVPGLTRYAPV
jgi:hypothetical protein